MKAPHNCLKMDQKASFPPKGNAGEKERANEAEKEFAMSCKGQ